MRPHLVDRRTAPLRRPVVARTRIRMLAAVLCWGLVAGPAPAGAAEVDVVIAEDGVAYAQAAEAAREEIGNRATIQLLKAAQWDPARYKPDVVLALGTRALQTVLAAAPPPGTVIVATLLPRASFDRAVRGAPKVAEGRIGAVFLDQPPARQLNLVRLVVPGTTRVGVLTGAGHEDLLPPLRTAARDAKIALREEPVADTADLHAALTRLLPEADAVLAVPDGTIWNAGTLHNILVTTYRAQRPVFGFSAAYVRAGALAAVYSTPQQVAKQAAELVVRALGGAPLPPPQWPRQFAVSMNPTVARSLDVAAEDEAALARRLARMERE